VAGSIADRRSRQRRSPNLKIAIELRGANRYHARNDEDFAFLQEDPRFTETALPGKRWRILTAFSLCAPPDVLS